MKKLLLSPQVIGYVVLIVGVLFILNVVMKRLGIKKTSSEKRADVKEKQQAIEIIKTPWLSPMTWQGMTNFKKIQTNEALQHAEDLNDSFGVFNDNEGQIYSTFRKLPNKVNISQVADAYYKEYGDDLRGDLIEYLSTEELAILQQIIESLPNK